MSGNISKVKVNTSAAYDCIIGENILESCGKITAKYIKKCHVCIITDENVAPLYLSKVENSFNKAGFQTDSFVFCGGEENKSLKTIETILEKLASLELTRSDILVALGGGIVGDVTGFAAACYLRGIKFIQIPTTLLAAVDSSVGGKTGVNLSSGKNLAGAFHQPSLVICDTSTFSTMDSERYLDGVGEIVKYAVLKGEDVLDIFEKNKIDGICRCIEIKRDIVEKDEKESGERKLLNLGHTFGHAIEKLSGYKITHGHAVAIGMAMITEIGEKLSFSEKGTADKVKQMLIKQGLPTKTDIDPIKICSATKNDKKRSGDKITFVIPEKIGKCIFKDFNITEMEELIK